MAIASEIIRDALQEILVQAAEQPLSGDEVNTAIRYLNRLMASWPTDLEFTEIADPDDVLTSPSYADRAIVLNLAIELAPQFNKMVSQDLRDNASDAYKNMLLQAQELLEASYSSNLPLGSGNRTSGSRFRAYYSEPTDA